MVRSLLITVLHIIVVLDFKAAFSNAQHSDYCRLTKSIKNGYVTSIQQRDEIYRENQIVSNSDEVQYGCVSGHTLVGNKRNVCINGNWINPQPKCELLCNPRNITSPTFLANCHTHQGNRRKYVSCAEPAHPGTVAQINCQRSYENRKTEQQIVTCGNDGRWHPSPEPCVQTCGEEGPEGNPLVVGGLATNLTKVPWNVGIYQRISGARSFQQICGGTIVNARVVISAMHCFWDRSEGKPFEITEFRVAAGKFFRDYESGENLKTQTFSIDRLYRIDDYLDTKGLFAKDIAVIILNSYLDFNTHIAPACLDYDTAPEEAVIVDSYGRVAGWGLESSNGLPSPVLKLIELPVIDREKCILDSDPTFAPFITDDKFCAGYLTGSSVCQGDSGAGLVFERVVNGKKKFFLSGIVSTGANKDGSCDNDKYATFTNVAKFGEFIKSYEIAHRPENSGALDVTSNVLITEVQPMSCKITEIPINGFVSLSNSPGDFLKFGETVGNQQLIEYTCINNLTLIGKSRNICFKGEWIYEIPTCAAGPLASMEVRQPCRIVSELKNGYIDFAYSPFQRLFLGDAVNSGSSVVYHCDDDFELVGSDRNFCADGIWNQEPPRCVSNCSLNVLDEILHLDYNCAINGSNIPCSDHAQPGTILQVNCSNIIATEPTQAICESDGEWAPGPKLTTCISSCGKDATPWEVDIYDGRNSRRCNSKILTPKVTLASAYCFWNVTTNQVDDFFDYRAVVGEAYQLDDSTNTYLLDNLVYDASYKLTGSSADVFAFALAFLKRSIQFEGRIIPSCLYQGSDYENVLRYGVSGYIPELTTYTNYTSNQVVETRILYSQYKDWVVPKLRSHDILNKLLGGL